MRGIGDGRLISPRANGCNLLLQLALWIGVSKFKIHVDATHTLLDFAGKLDAADS
jgi:hypothetical protein